MENSSTNSVGFSKVKYENASEGTGISTNVYNLIMGGMILYGIIINIVMCIARNWHCPSIRSFCLSDTSYWLSQERSWYTVPDQRRSASSDIT